MARQRNETATGRTGVCNGPCLCCAVNQHWRDSHPSSDDVSTVIAHHKGVFSMALPKRPAPNNIGPKPGEEWTDPEFKADFPNIHAFLYDITYADKTPRATGTINLFTQFGALKAAVNDKDRQLVAFVTAPTWEELIVTIDMGIGDDSLDWKAMKGIPGGKTPTF